MEGPYLLVISKFAADIIGLKRKFSFNSKIY